VNWQADQRGDFFERFVADILRPLRFRVRQRLRFTGMEIDLLAEGLDQPNTVLVECKAQRDPLPADTISKLLGNVTIKGADAGWLFSASDLSKDGRGQWTEIQANPELAKRFVWYPPERLIEILIDQRVILEPSGLLTNAREAKVGDGTLVWSPAGTYWLLELLQDGLPTFYVVFDASTGSRLDEAAARSVASASDRFTPLQHLAPADDHRLFVRPPKSVRAPVARVLPGDAWADLRPARPIDFVGRDDVIQDILAFIEDVRVGATPTRTFAVKGPSGWGKSSLVLKLGALAQRGRRISSSSVTCVDTRSATNAGFVSSALRLAFQDAAHTGLIPKAAPYDISSLTHPLESPDLLAGLSAIGSAGGVMVLIFDQFEELFTKESLFETFNAIRELSLDLDSKQSRLVLGFAWKTDISLPQEHPAYHLWHQLAGRRRDFAVRQFGSGDIGKVISRAQRETGLRLVPALRARLVEQCQGYPWLLKKLLVHVGQRLRTSTSQFALLERELDVEVLFKEDLEGLKAEQLRCLRHVAQRAPAYVSEVEEHFRSDVTNSLLSKGLLVRSGLNYVVYWDIFRDYLTEGRVPQIPWTRTFQRDPRSAVRALQATQATATVSARQLAKRLGGTERAWVNVMSDLVALQIVDRIADDQYRLASHIGSTASLDLAQHTNTQLARHVICRELASHDRSLPVTVERLEAIVRGMRPGTRLSDLVVHQYAMNFKRWLLFAGHLEERSGVLYRPVGRGAQTGELTAPRVKDVRFLGCGTPDALMQLVRRLQESRLGLHNRELQGKGFRNALYDAAALQLVVRARDGNVSLVGHYDKPRLSADVVRGAVLRQPCIQIIAAVLEKNAGIANAALGIALREKLGESWKSTSALRYANGLRRYYRWACEKQ
jgi:hypothetical protein